MITRRLLSKSLFLNSRPFCTKAEEKIDFGFKTVNYGERQSKVNEVFDSVAESYDVMNDAMSLGVHRLWKNYFVESIGKIPNGKKTE
jgi:hypothetical protein